MTSPTPTANGATGSAPSESSSPERPLERPFEIDTVREFEEKSPGKAIDRELQAIKEILLALLPLNHEQSRRALQYAIDFYKLSEAKKHPLDDAVRR